MKTFVTHYALHETIFVSLFSVVHVYFFSPGLKEAQEKVDDYSPLMKDFPVNELLAAGSLEAIKIAVAAIYSHLRKIRTTSYPAQRAIYLVEAISRDLSTQLLKVKRSFCVCVCVCVHACVAFFLLDVWY